MDSVFPSSSVAMAKVDAHFKIKERKLTLETYTKGLADVEDPIKSCTEKDYKEDDQTYECPQ